MSDLPPSTTRPCDECPWRRASIPGYVGPHDAETWVAAAHSDAPIACHKTISTSSRDGETDTSYTHQCAGAAVFRANVHKMPRDPSVARMPADRERTFASNQEFLAHHDLQPRMMQLRKWMLEEWSGCPTSWTKARMVDKILSYGAVTHHITLTDYEGML